MNISSISDNEDWLNQILNHEPTFKFKDGIFSFWTAQFGSSHNDARIVFRVREDSQPKIRAKEKGIEGFDRIYPALPYEILKWMISHEVEQNTETGTFELKML